MPSKISSKSHVGFTMEMRNSVCLTGRNEQSVVFIRVLELTADIFILILP